jgi:hypothetical protein
MIRRIKFTELKKQIIHIRFHIEKNFNFDSESQINDVFYQ